jgi:hypothetical protein
MSLEKFVQDRCIEEGECWIWQQSANGGRPQMQVPGTRRRTAVRRALWLELRNPDLASKAWVTTKCETPGCVNPEHLCLTTNAKAQKKAGEQGKFSTLARRAKVAASKQASVSRLTLEDVVAIRASDEILRVLAERYGVAKNTVWAIRNGTRWRNYSSPFAGLGI